MTPRVSTHRRWLLVALTGFVLTASSRVVFAQGGFLGLGGDRNVKYRLYKDPANRFEIEYPEKDWKQVSLAVTGFQLAGFQHKDDPSLFVDRELLSAAYSKEELELLPQTELEQLRSQERPAKDFKSESIETRSGRATLISYFQIGKGPERVLVCVIPLGRDLYRLHGVVPEKLYKRFEPILLHMMKSFKSPATSAVPAK